MRRTLFSPGATSQKPINPLLRTLSCRVMLPGPAAAEGPPSAGSAGLLSLGPPAGCKSNKSIHGDRQTCPRSAIRMQRGEPFCDRRNATNAVFERDAAWHPTYISHTAQLFPGWNWQPALVRY